jgi:hypothetical protein
MVIESRACPSCEDFIPPGRLSCPHCGAVLAAVANRVSVGVTTESRAPAKRPARTKRGPSAATRKAVVTEHGWDVDAEAGARPDPIEPVSVEPPLDEPTPDVRSGWLPAAAAEMTPPAIPDPQEPLVSAAARWAAVADDAWDADPDDGVSPGPVEPASDEPAVDDPASAVHSPWATATPVAAATAAAAAFEKAPPPAPGAYLPPAVEPEPPPALLAEEPPSPPAMAAPSDPPPAPILPRAWDPVAAASGEGVLAAAPAGPGRVGRIAMPRIDRARVEEVADTIMLVGSFGLVLSFLAPWADTVIGSRGRGYMDTWGLAGSGHIALFLLALGVLALAALENPIGRWLRTGVAGVALGGFVLGLAWPYVVGPLGAGPGALLAWVSGLVLFVAGIISLLVLRHAALPPDV